jgi:hypothetical protein
MDTASEVVKEGASITRKRRLLYSFHFTARVSTQILVIQLRYYDSSTRYTAQSTSSNKISSTKTPNPNICTIVIGGRPKEFRALLPSGGEALNNERLPHWPPIWPLGGARAPPQLTRCGLQLLGDSHATHCRWHSCTLPHCSTLPHNAAHCHTYIATLLDSSCTLPVSFP